LLGLWIPGSGFIRQPGFKFLSGRVMDNNIFPPKIGFFLKKVISGVSPFMAHWQILIGCGYLLLCSICGGFTIAA
jgi:hypothetical protein